MHSWPARAALFLLAWAAIGASADAQERIGSALLSRERDTATAAMRIRLGAAIEGAARPNMSGHVTAVPYDPALPTVQVAIKGIGARREHECTSKLGYYWVLELADIANGAYLAYRPDLPGHIGDAVILYPPRPRAKFMAHSRVWPGELPAGYAHKQLTYAIDFDADGRADYVEVKLCCAPLGKDGACPSGSQCWKAFRRTPRAWREVWHREEC